MDLSKVYPWHDLKGFIQKMTYNFFKFSTLTVTAALGLGLMVSGCSDGGGKTTVYPFNPAPVPTPTPFTVPFDTVATFALLVVHVIVLFEALAGEIAAFIVADPSLCP